MGLLIMDQYSFSICGRPENINSPFDPSSVLPNIAVNTSGTSSAPTNTDVTTTYADDALLTFILIITRLAMPLVAPPGWINAGTKLCNLFLSFLPHGRMNFFRSERTCTRAGLFAPAISGVDQHRLRRIVHPYVRARCATRMLGGRSAESGATPEGIILTVLQICVSIGVEACAKGVPILAED